MSAPAVARQAMEDDAFRVFIFGLAILFGWMAVVIICASPQLFRNLLKRHVCCWFVDVDDKNHREKIKEATERMLTARQSIIASNIAGKPTEIMLGQVLGIHSIPEESRASTVAPADSDDGTEMAVLSVPSVS